MTARLLVAGLNHRTAPVEVREKVAVPGWRLKATLRDLQEACGGEVVILSTCNRAEVYAVTDQSLPDCSCPPRGEPAALVARLAGTDDSGAPPAAEALLQHVYAYCDAEAVSHLYRVASGLDSMVLGETEILGQVKDLYEAACAAGTAGPTLHALFQGALRVGARARTETNISANAVSVPYVALGLARKVFADLSGRNALLIGTGDIGRVALRHLVEAGLGGIVAANRTLERAEEALSSLDVGTSVRCRAADLTALPQLLASSDIVVACSEAPHYILGPADLKAAAPRRRHPLLLIDLGVPRQIDPALGAREDVYLFNLDDLEGAVQANIEERRREAVKVERMVAEEVERFEAARRRKMAAPVIRHFRARAETIRTEEVERALGDLGPVSPRDRELLEAFSRRLTNRILDLPTVTLRELVAQRDGTAVLDVVGRVLHGELAVRRETRERREEADLSRDPPAGLHGTTKANGEVKGNG